MIANLVELEKWYKDREVSPSPKKGQSSQAPASEPEAPAKDPSAADADA